VIRGPRGRVGASTPRAGSPATWTSLSGKNNSLPVGPRGSFVVSGQGSVWRGLQNPRCPLPGHSPRGSPPRSTVVWVSWPGQTCSAGLYAPWLPHRLGRRDRQNSYLVDPASSHMLVSKIKPCMSKYKQLYTVKLRTAHYISNNLFDGSLLHG
jgi:hypothetical protein